jgi:hypothetical protein
LNEAVSHSVPTAAPQTAAAAPAGGTAGSRDKKHVSVVYFHGIGSQRRYEEVARLTDCIDLYLNRTSGPGTPNSCRLASVKPTFEPKHDAPDETVTYLSSELLPLPKGPPLIEVRYYECYWAPVMADVGSATGVLKWVWRQSWRPLTGRKAQWRELHRLRRAALSALYEDRASGPGGEDRGRYDAMMRLFDDFDGHDGKRDFPRGQFDDFLRYIDRRTDDNDEAAALRKLARDWHDRFWTDEQRNAKLIVTLLLTLALTFIALVFVAYRIVTNLPAILSFIGTSETLVGLVADNLPTTLGAVAAVVFSLIVGGRIGYYLSHYLGDVEAWATFAETSVKYDKRAKVIEQGSALMRHVIQNEDCERVVVIGHSLGTSIAHDVLLALRRVNLAAGGSDKMSEPLQLKKIRHFITLGSPVDKINYFFESYRTASHRYARVVETLRGDIGTEPFADNRRPHIHWVNYWDEADPISGALQSPVARRSLRYRVDNVHVPGLRFPSPGAAHLAYFQSRRVIGDIFDIVYRNRHTYDGLLPAAEKTPVDYDVVRLGPGEPTGLYRFQSFAAAVVPWGALASGIAWWTGWTGLAVAAGAVAAAGAASLCIWWLGARSDHRDPY